MGGVRLLRFKDQPGVPGAHRTGPYADADLTYRFGPKTELQVRYLRDVSYSPFVVTGPTPTSEGDTVTLRLQKGLGAGFDVIGFGTYMTLGTNGTITIVRDNGERATAVRNDTIREGGLDLGHWFRKLRIGVAAVYTNRTSTISDFGIHGLLVGGTVTYQPGLSWSR